MQFWTNSVPEAAWIAIFLVLPIVFNLLNVRRYGEIEFWLTTTKVTMIVILIVLGILLPMGASPENMLLGTSADYRPVPCDQNVIGECLPTHGFNCLTQLQDKRLTVRLEAGPIQNLYRYRH
jgi:amino acid transporter